MIFQRPEWFLALIPLALLALWHWRRKRGSRSWGAVIDARLLPHLLLEQRGQSSKWSLLVFLLISILAIVAVAGPAWQKLSQPVFKQQGALVIALDLSRSMNAADIRPSRLERARLKLTDLLQRRKEGQTALIAYAASPFTVTPLTDDFDTILSLLPSLTTDLMPSQGSRADLALAKAIELLDNAGRNEGDILFVTDGINDTSFQHIMERHMPGFRLSLLAVGTEQGAPARNAKGEFVKERGSIVLARSDFSRMAQLAEAKEGMFNVMAIDDSDVLAIEKFIESGANFDDQQETEFEADQWQEEGPWLLLIVTPLAALAFRRGFLLPALLVCVLLPAARPVEAAPGWWDRLWRNADQLGKQQLDEGNPDQAARLFDNPDWKAAASYRAGDYEQALQQLEGADSADALYNRGNALANLGRLDEALHNYDQALQRDPAHEDAAYNREVVQQALEQQQSSSDDANDGKDKDEKEDKQEQEDKDEQKEQEKEGDEQDKQQANEEKGDKQKDQKQDGQQQQEEQSQSGDRDQQPSDPQQNGQQDERPGQKPGEREDSDQPDPNEAREDDAQSMTPDEKEQQEQPMAGEEPADSNVQRPEPQPDMSEMAEMQWLRRVPDDPGGLLRNKFRYQYSRQRSAQPEKEPW